MAGEHKGWKQNLQSIPKLECGNLSCVSWNRPLAWTALLSEVYICPIVTLVMSLTWSSSLFLLWLVNRWSSFSFWILLWGKHMRFKPWYAICVFFMSSLHLKRPYYALFTKSWFSFLVYQNRFSWLNVPKTYTFYTTY